MSCEYMQDLGPYEWCSLSDNLCDSRLRAECDEWCTERPDCTCFHCTEDKKAEGDNVCDQCGHAGYVTYHLFG